MCLNSIPLKNLIGTKMNIYFYEYYDPDWDNQDKPTTAYFLAESECDADAQFKQYSNSHFDVTNGGWYSPQEIEQYDLIHKIADFSFAVDDDALLMFVIDHFPDHIPNFIENLLHSTEMPQSFARALCALPGKENLSHYLQILVGNNSLKYIQISIEQGISDPQGLALARTCMHAKKDFFDAIYPVSNPIKALTVEGLRRGEWIEQRLAEDQKFLLHNSIAVTPQSSKSRKM